MNKTENFSFLSGEDARRYGEMVGDPSLLEYSFPEKFAYVSILNSAEKAITAVRSYAEIQNDTALKEEIGKPVNEINWLSVEAYFEILYNLLDVDSKDEIKPYFPFSDMDLQRYIVRNHGNVEVGKQVYEEYSRRSDLSGKIMELIQSQYTPDQGEEPEATPEELHLAIVNGRSPAYRISEAKAIEIIQEKAPDLYDSLGEILDFGVRGGLLFDPDTQAQEVAPTLSQGGADLEGTKAAKPK